MEVWLCEQLFRRPPRAQKEYVNVELLSSQLPFISLVFEKVQCYAQTLQDDETDLMSEEGKA